MSRSIAVSPAKPAKRAGKRPKATAKPDIPGHGQELMQTVLDNMSEGVCLFDSDLRLRFINRQCIEFQSFPASVVYPGASAHDIIRFQIERGDFGPVIDIERMLAERVALARQRGGYRYDRRTAGGQHIDFTFKVLADGGLLVVCRDITQLKRVEESLRTAGDVLRVISRPNFNLQSVLDTLVVSAARLCEADSSFVFCLGRTAYRLSSSHGFSDQYREYMLRQSILPGRNTLVGRTALEGAIVHIPDAVNDPEYTWKESQKLGGFRTMLGVPLLRDGEAIGVIALTRSMVKPFTASQIDLMRTFADQAVIAIQTTRLFDETKEALARQTATAEVLRVIGESMTDAQPVFDAIVRHVEQLLAARYVAMYLAKGDQLDAVAFNGNWEFERIARNYPRPLDDQTITGKAMRLRQVLQLAPIVGNPASPARTEQIARDFEFGSIVAVPLIRKGHVIGGIATARHEPVAFGDRQVALIKSFADQAVIAIENARLFEDVKAARDVAEKERAEAEAANQAKSTFLATMSHEIRTPLNGVLGMMEVLERQGLGEPQRRSVATMRDSAQALLRIIDDVLDFSKIEAGRLELEETVFALSELVQGTLGTFRQQARAKGLALNVEIASGSADVLVGDPTRVRQILFNLVGNAIKFTERGRIGIEAGTRSLGGGRTRLVLSVTDTGIGLSAQQCAGLFKPFAQADSSTTRRFGGTGLGLSIVRRLAHLMNGDVAVQSTAGAGSTFTVTLVLHAAPAGQLPKTEVRPPIPDQAGRPGAAPSKVLVADDHPVNRDVLVRQLELLGIDADSAEDGAAALAAWERGGYAAILTDIHMPAMDGYELVQRVREVETGADRRPRTPVIAVTANALKGEEQRCLAVGMDAYITKPISMEKLRLTLQRWLPIREPSAEAAQPPRPGNEVLAIDASILGAWLGDDAAAVAALLGKFASTAVEAQSEIASAMRQGKLAVVAAAAHKLNGAARAVGAIGVAEVAARLEQAAKAGDRATCSAALRPLAREIRRVLAAVEQA